MKYYFILICKSPTGSIYPSAVMYSAEQLQVAFANCSKFGVRVIDVKLITFNPAVYE